MYGHTGTHATVLEDRRTTGTNPVVWMAGNEPGENQRAFRGGTIRFRRNRSRARNSPSKVCASSGLKQQRGGWRRRIFRVRLTKSAAGAAWTRRSDDADPRNLTRTAFQNAGVVAKTQQFRPTGHVGTARRR